MGPVPDDQPDDPFQEAVAVPTAATVLAAALPEGIEEHTVSVATPDGPTRMRFRFKRPRTTQDMAGIWRLRDELNKRGKFEVDGIMLYVGNELDDAALVNIAMVRTCLVEPEMTEDQLLAVSQRNGPLFIALAMKAAELCLVTDWSELDDAKKGSAAA